MVWSRGRERGNDIIIISENKRNYFLKEVININIKPYQAAVWNICDNPVSERVIKHDISYEKMPVPFVFWILFIFSCLT